MNSKSEKNVKQVPEEEKVAKAAVMVCGIGVMVVVFSNITYYTRKREYMGR